MSTNAKTNRRRVIDLEAITLAELRKLAESSVGQADELVFGIKSNFTRGWKSVLKAAQVTGARFHDARATAIESEPQKAWRKTGFFKSQSRPMSRRVVNLKAESLGRWLEPTLTEPMPARIVVKLAQAEGIPLKGLKRAKKRLKVKSVKTGGSRHGWGAVWLWKFPDCVS